MFTRPRLLTAVVALLAMACAGGTAAPAASSDGSPFRVVMIVGLSGVTASTSTASINSMKLSINAVNKAGGIGGRQAQLEVLDDASDATKAQSILVERLASGPKPDLVVAGNASNETLAMLPTLTKNKILQMGITAASAINDPATYPYAFNTSDDLVVGADALVAYLKSKSFKRIGRLLANDALGQSINAQWDPAFQAAGFTSLSASFAPTALDLTPQLGQLRAQNPDVVIFNAAGAPNGIVLQNRLKLGWTVPFIMYFSSTGSTDLLAAAGSVDAIRGVTELTYSRNQWVAEGQRDKAIQAFITAFKALGPIQKLLTTITWAYDILQLVKVAADQAKATDTVRISQAMENLKQPASPPWISQKVMGFSKSNHFLHLTLSDYAFVPAGPIVDGMVQPAT
jgi:branched-chain amino acid transport system substrate-binding protein